VKPGQWFVLHDQDTLESKPFGDDVHRYIVLTVSGPSVTLFPRTSNVQRTHRGRRLGPPFFAHARHRGCVRGCRIDKDGFILRMWFSFDWDALRNNYSCEEQDPDTWAWVFES
jgi:hypothetical protein